MSRTDAFGRTSEPLERGPTSSRLTREQLVDRIMTLNPTATNEFLARFGDDDLEDYLQRLNRAAGPRSRHEVWVRPPGGPAVSSRTAGQ